jgi:uncharacterized protein (DUF362 family)
MKNKHTLFPFRQLTSLIPRRLSRRHFLRTLSALLAGLAGSHLFPGNLLASSGVDGADAGLQDDPGIPPRVALAQATSYDRDLIRAQVRRLIDDLGGLGDVVSPGDKVAIKVNLTGGVWGAGLTEADPIDTYFTHPEVVRALGEAVLEAGASELYIVEAVFDEESFSKWGYTDLAADLGATLVDLNRPAPYKDFVSKSTGDKWSVYREFTFNQILVDVDVFMSVPKMKCHASAGVTLAMKNLVGLVPVQFYRLEPQDWARLAMHGSGTTYRTRVPRMVVDLNLARPIDFALIDGVKASESGEGPWNVGWNPVEPGILVAGKNALATDAVAAAAMGFDPAAKAFVEAPFRFSSNHLQLAHETGLGPNTLDKIELVGTPLAEARFVFRPYGATEEEYATGHLHHPGPYHHRHSV